jgi:hypothetical protein
MNNTLLCKQLKTILLEQKQTYTEDEILELIKTNLPRIRIEIPKGTTDSDWSKAELPFDYGDFPDYINPQDGMGWDIIITPSSNVNPNLEAVGIIRYKPETGKSGNGEFSHHLKVVGF